jgi:hypothetical protein
MGMNRIWLRIGLILKRLYMVLHFANTLGIPMKSG